MEEWRKVEEVGLIECQTCKKKNLCSKKILGKNFLLYKNIAYFNSTIRIVFDQCGFNIQPFNLHPEY